MSGTQVRTQVQVNKALIILAIKIQALSQNCKQNAGIAQISTKQHRLDKTIYSKKSKKTKF